MASVHTDSFSGPASDLKGKSRTDESVLRVLGKHPRMSVWDMGENPWLCSIVKRLEDEGKIISDKNEPFPWFRFVVTHNQFPEVQK